MTLATFKWLELVLLIRSCVTAARESCTSCQEMQVTCSFKLLLCLAEAPDMGVAETDMSDMTDMTGTGEALALTAGADAVHPLTGAEALALTALGA